MKTAEQHSNFGGKIFLKFACSSRDKKSKNALKLSRRAEWTLRSEPVKSDVEPGEKGGKNLKKERSIKDRLNQYVKTGCLKTTSKKIPCTHYHKSSEKQAGGSVEK